MKHIWELCCEFFAWTKSVVIDHSYTVFVSVPAHAPKIESPVASDYVPSPVLNTENHQLTLC